MDSSKKHTRASSIYALGSMKLISLPTWMVGFYGINVSEYTSSMDPMGHGKKSRYVCSPMNIGRNCSQTEMSSSNHWFSDQFLLEGTQTNQRFSPTKIGGLRNYVPSPKLTAKALKHLKNLMVWRPLSFGAGPISGAIGVFVCRIFFWRFFLRGEKEFC